VLLGITKASLQTPSFISAASFQETTRADGSGRCRQDRHAAGPEGKRHRRPSDPGRHGRHDEQIRRIATSRDELILEERRKASGVEVAEPMLTDMTAAAQ
jgi:DNA-directed RNA polymerase subunit beta'